MVGCVTEIPDALIVPLTPTVSVWLVLPLELLELEPELLELEPELLELEPIPETVTVCTASLFLLSLT